MELSEPTDITAELGRVAIGACGVVKTTVGMGRKGAGTTGMLVDMTGKESTGLAESVGMATDRTGVGDEGVSEGVDTASMGWTGKVEGDDGGSRIWYSILVKRP